MHVRLLVSFLYLGSLCFLTSANWRPPSELPQILRSLGEYGITVAYHDGERSQAHAMARYLARNGIRSSCNNGAENDWPIMMFSVESALRNASSRIFPYYILLDDTEWGDETTMKMLKEVNISLYTRTKETAFVCLH